MPIDLGQMPHDVDLDSNPEWDTQWLRFSTESMVSPATVWEQNIATGERNMLKRSPTPNIDLGDYETQRYWATSLDGTKVPYDIVRLKNAQPNGAAPAMVYAYGSYEISIPPWFSVARLSLVDRGWTWVLAHPRGGGEMGRNWYLNGRLENKRNTFDDVNAIADAVIDAGWAAAGHIGVRGGSAGGLMVLKCWDYRHGNVQLLGCTWCCSTRLKFLASC